MEARELIAWAVAALTALAVLIALGYATRELRAERRAHHRAMRRLRARLSAGRQRF